MNQDVTVRPSMSSIYEEMNLLLPFFPGSSDPIQFAEPGKFNLFAFIRKETEHKFGSNVG